VSKLVLDIQDKTGCLEAAWLDCLVTKRKFAAGFVVAPHLK